MNISDSKRMDVSPLQLSGQTENLTYHNQSASGGMCEFVSGSVQFLSPEHRLQVSSGNAGNVTENFVSEQPGLSQNNTGQNCQNGEHFCLQQIITEKACEFASNCGPKDTLEERCQLTPKQSPDESIKVNAKVNNTPKEVQSQLFSENVGNTSNNEKMESAPEDVAQSTCSQQLDTPPKSLICCWSDNAVIHTSRALKKNYMLRSSGAGERELRSKANQKVEAPGSNNQVVNNHHEQEKKRRKKKLKRRNEEVKGDEFSKIKSGLRYLLNRISYEQSLIDAYSGEGWKGYSLEKIKPEKELQRAKSEILRRKLKIRDLFHQLDLLCAQGRLPRYLFDSEGEICSEDIFCASCGSKELTPNNDIILCDGACDRGFHQFCLEPPLLNENIPPDDEGWLCPGCDCKDDCIELLNDSLGTNLSFNDSWEKVFPEVAAKLAGCNENKNIGLPSDDSDDNDYNPDVPENEEVQGTESSSDESEYTSAPEELEAPCGEDPYMGLPSDDSEDDDFDPDAPEHESQVNEESSSSDFTSDSEDLAAVVEDNGFSENDVDPVRKKKSKTGTPKQSLGDELSSLLKSNLGQEGSAPVSGKRNIERLDYKKLYNETYQNASTDSSDDEEWIDRSVQNRNKGSGNIAHALSNGNVPTIKHRQKEGVQTPERRTCQDSNIEDKDNTPSKSLECGSSDAICKSSSSKRLGEATIQRLYITFQENQYPDRAKKESLAEELGLTFQQVNKWFGNARWSFRHTSRMDAIAAKSTWRPVTGDRAQNDQEVGDGDLFSKESNKQGTPTSSLRKKKRQLGDLSDPNSEVDGTTLEPCADAPKAHRVQTSSRKKWRQSR